MSEYDSIGISDVDTAIPQGAGTQNETAQEGNDSKGNEFQKHMETLDSLNQDAIKEGYNRLGYWIGPRLDETWKVLQPVFILAQPVDSVEPMSWVPEDGIERKSFNLIRRYVCITPGGPISVWFNKRNVDESGQKSEIHRGPGGDPDLDHDDVEGGEVGTFLNLLNSRYNRRETAYTTAGPVDLGLGQSQDGQLVLKIGHSQMEEAYYKESSPKNSFWGLERTVENDVIRRALKKSLDTGRTKPPENVNEKSLKEQSDLIGEILQ